MTKILPKTIKVGCFNIEIKVLPTNISTEVCGEEGSFHARQRIIYLAEDIVEDKPPEKGCSFQGRCPRKIGDICNSEVPPWQIGENGNAIRCHINIEELASLQQ